MMRPEVGDNGPKIAPGERDKVFERFYRSAQGEAHDFGLRLTIVCDICASHGACISPHNPAHACHGLCVRMDFKPEQSGREP